MTDKSISEHSYTDTLLFKESVWWRKIFNAQYPHCFNLRNLKPGFVLDIGCSMGRNLLHLDGYGVGIDHNPASVEVCKALGLNAFTESRFLTSEFNNPETFDSMLVANVVDYMTTVQAANIIKQYMPLIVKGGKIIVITSKQPAVKAGNMAPVFNDFEQTKDILTGAGCHLHKQYTFPFPKIAGNVFKYNQFVSVGTK